MRQKVSIFLVLCATAWLPLAAQTFDDDARLWLYLKFDKDLNKRWNAHVMLQNRLDNNISQYSQGYADFGFTYKVTKTIRIMADYVYGEKRQLEGTYSRIHQLYAGFIFKKHLRNFVFTYRNIVQGQMKNIYSSEKGRQPLFYERNKVTLRYELNKRWEVFAAEELNIPFYRASGEVYFNRSRTFVGVTHNLSKHSSLEAYFLFQRQLHYESPPKRDFVYGVTYSHSF